MRFRSEREKRLASSVIAQMISLIESLLQRMEPIQSDAELSETEAGSLLLGRLWATSPQRELETAICSD
jgi:hypothetical protein